MNTYADDLAALIEALDLRDVILVGFSTGGGEVARYVGRHGTDRVAKVALVSAVTPFMLRTDDNPGGVAIEVFDELRAASRGRPVPAVPRPRRRPVLRARPSGRGGVRRGSGTRSGLQGMQSGHRNALECIRAFSETDFRADLAAIDVPTLVIHGDDDQVVPFAIGGPGLGGARARRRPWSSTRARPTASPTRTGRACARTSWRSLGPDGSHDRLQLRTRPRSWRREPMSSFRYTLRRW